MNRFKAIASTFSLSIAIMLVFGVAARESAPPAAIPTCTTGCNAPAPVSCSPEKADGTAVDPDGLNIVPNIVSRIMEI